MSAKPWEYMSSDEKLDYIKERLDNIDASLSVLAKALEPKHPLPVASDKPDA